MCHIRLSPTALMKCLAAAMTLSLSGCVYDYPPKECFMTASVEVRFDWSLADGSPLPDGMGVMMYPGVSPDYFRFDMPPEGAEISLKDNTYSVISYNNDSSDILFRDDDGFGRFKAVTASAQLSDGRAEIATGQRLPASGSEPPRPRGAESEPVRREPDMLFAAAREGFTVPPPMQADGATIMRLQPRPMTVRYSVTVDEVENIMSVASASIAISGQSEGILLSGPQRLPQKVTVPGTVVSGTINSLSGEILTFGVPDGEVATTLSLYVWLRDGSKMAFEFPVSDQIEPHRNDTHISLRVKGVRLPQVSAGSGTGMEVDVDEWESVFIELST